MRRIVNGREVEMTPQEVAAHLADERARAASAPIPDATPLQLIEELEARGLIDTFLGLMSPVEQLKFAAARVIYRSDPRVAQMGPALGLASAGIDQLFRDAAAR